jgi:hypothetical protein
MRTLEIKCMHSIDYRHQVQELGVYLLMKMENKIWLNEMHFRGLRLSHNSFINQ